MSYYDFLHARQGEKSAAEGSICDLYRGIAAVFDRIHFAERDRQDGADEKVRRLDMALIEKPVFFLGILQFFRRHGGPPQQHPGHGDVSHGFQKGHGMGKCGLELG